MPKFSADSLQKLQTCHLDLQLLFGEVIKSFDCKVIVGNRSKEEQDKAFAEKKSKLQFPNSKHNSMPAMAVDVMPCAGKELDWGDTKRILYFAGHVMGIAAMLKEQGKIRHAVRYGGDWDSDTDLKDNKFQDLVHFELV
jgi:peptidoglycan L-alanyl-D-glutamate endopeptidase CwlK